MLHCSECSFLTSIGLSERGTTEYLHTPNMRGVSERVESICAPLGIHFIFTPNKCPEEGDVKMNSQLPEEKEGLVYQIPRGVHRGSHGT